MTSSSSSRQRVFGLDLMRAIAILAVLGSHILYIFPEQYGGVIPLLQLGGVMGVEIFFVLSGYLIGSILLRLFVKEDFGMRDVKYFLVRRWFRTLPSYYLALVLNILLVIAIGRQLPENIPYYFLFLQNFSSGMEVFFTESWSLPVEEVAYIIGPLLSYVVVYAFAKAKKETLFLGSTIAVIIVFLITKLLYHFTTPTLNAQQWNINLKAVVIYRIDAIYYGVLAAYLSHKYPNHWLKHKQLLFALGVILFFGFQFVLGKYSLDPVAASFIWDVIYLPLTSIAIALTLPVLSSWRQAPRFIAVPIRYVSITSYAVYLLHYGLLLQGMRWVWPIELLSFNERVGYAAIYFILLFLIAGLWYGLYEKPMTDLRDKHFITSRYKH